MFGKKKNKKIVVREIKKIISKLTIPFSEKDIKKLKKKYYFASAEDILAYLMNRSNKLNQLIKAAQEGKRKVITTDFALYEAISSARGNIEVPLERLKILLWNITIIPQEKIKINRERMNEIRKAYGGV